MKKILIFTTAYWPLIGGAEVAVKEITDRLLECEFDLITARIDKNFLKEERVGRVNVYRVGLGSNMDKFLLPVLGLLKALKLNKNNKYEFTWSIMASYAGFLALFFKYLTNKPFILTLQEGDSEKHILKKVGIFYPLWKQIFKKANRVTVISKYLKDFALRYGALCVVDIIPNGVDIDKFHILERKLGNKKIILTTSRLVKKNGVDDLIKAMSFLDDDYYLLIVGSGEEEKKLKSLSNEMGVNERVKFVGFVKQEEIFKYYEMAHVFCRPSISEGFGISFIEAMAAGVPVVATPVGGITDFLEDGKTGFFCKVKDPESIALKVEYILDEKNKEKIESVVKNARQMVLDKYNWDIISLKMGEIFNLNYEK